MITNSYKTSLQIPSQLPEYIRDNPDTYGNFISFLQAYYEWMEQNGNVLDRTKNVLNYIDIDRTSAEFEQYFINDFLSNFPTDILIDKSKAVKLAKELYNSKGSPSSYQLLFRILYNSDFEFFNTKDAVLRASGGNWYKPRSLKINSSDPNFLKTKNYRLFGETSKTIATIENSVYAGNKIEVFISNIERLFLSGETVRVVDNNNQDVYFLNGEIVPKDTVGAETLTGKIVGQISSITINPNNRGLYYNIGDPVIVYSGVTVDNPVEAIAEVQTVTTGSIKEVNVLTGGYGYTIYPNTVLQITNAPGADVQISSVVPDANSIANVVLYPVDSIFRQYYIPIGNTRYNFSANTSANITATLANTFNFKSFLTYPISSTLVKNGGGGISSLPIIEAKTKFTTDSLETANAFSYLDSLGILGPIQINNGGQGYQANDTIVFTGGRGYGAYANVISVSASGAITNVAYVFGQSLYPLGGMGYKNDALPTLSVVSANVLASNASLYVPCILGTGATFDVVTDRTGSVSAIEVVYPGEDYSFQPSVSLKVQDIIVSNVTVVNLPEKGDLVYQGANINVATYIATVNSISLIQPFATLTDSIYSLRVFNYSSTTSVDKPIGQNGTINVDGRPINMIMSNTARPGYDSTGVKSYGDGRAKANAKFLGGLVISEGIYLDSSSHLSSFDILQNEDYNDFTYQITVEKEIAKYRDILTNLLHPAGLKVLGRYALKANNEYFDFHSLSALSTGYPAYSEYAFGSEGVTARMYSDFTNKSNNVVKFLDTFNTNLANIFIANTSVLSLSPSTGPSVLSKVIAINYDANTVTIDSNVWLTYSNVASATANASCTQINITSVYTDAYNIVNDGVYSNTMYPLQDILYVGDRISINNQVGTVSSIDYGTGLVTLSSPLTYGANGYLSVARTYIANSTNLLDEIKIFSPVGYQYIPNLGTENGYILTTENNDTILLG